MIKFLASLSLVLTPLLTLAWGGRGHHTICDAAVYLVKEEGLKKFLQAKPHVMGHLCNIPDIYWRSLGPDVDQFGSSTHYLDLELFAMDFKDIPLDYRKIITDYKGKKSPGKDGTVIQSVPTEFGSNWWRADQFFRRAISLGGEWKKTAVPANSKEQKDDNLAFNKLAYDFMVNLGLMGHFVGDNGQPFHSTTDYDGYETGHGGIHAYYEESLVAAMSPELLVKIIKQASQFRKNEKAYPFLSGKSTLEKMKALSLTAYPEIQKIFSLDKVKTPSVQKNEKGMSIRTPAEREPAEKMLAKFESMIVTDMARSAALLAQLWDEAYVQVGRPQLVSNKSYKYPLQPEFVVPDYFELKDIRH